MMSSMTMYPALLWGISLLLSVEATSAAITETNNINSTAEADQTTKQPTSVYVRHDETEEQPAIRAPTHKPAEVHATPRITVPPTEVVTNTEVRLLHTPTDTVAMRTASKNEPAPNGSMTETAKPTEDLLRHKSPTISTAMTPSETTSATSLTAAATMLPTTLPTAAATSATTATMSPTTSPTSAAMSATASPTTTTIVTTSVMATSLSQGRSTPEPHVTTELFSTAVPDNSTQVPGVIRELSSPSVSSTSSMTVNPTSGSTPVSNSTSSFSERTTEMPTTSSSSSSSTHSNSTQLPPSSKAISATTSNISTSAFPDTTELNASISTTGASNSSGGILIHVSPKKLPIPTSKSATPVIKVTESPPSTEAQSCSVRGIVKQCLIAVAALAVLATIFMVSTIILCTKLSVRKYRVKKPQQATEMMCISALLPERNHNYMRQRNPVSNGVLVIPSGGDSDDDGGDNLTLSSFLPENDRYV